jgi:hypothetical protein
VSKGTGDVEGRRIGVELGLGEYLEGWNGSQLKGRVVLGWILIGIAVLGGIGALETMHQSAAAEQQAGSAVGGMVVLLAIGVPLVAFPWRTRRLWLHHYEGGVVQVTGHRRRVLVVRWSDLASMSWSVVQGYDDEYISGPVLRDHAGNTLAAPSGLIAGRAEQVLVGRLVGPLTGRLDAGLPVTVGCLTVYQSGISCRGGGGKAGGRWEVSWPEVHDIETQFRSQRVTVHTGHRGTKRAALAGEPNDFLAEYVLEHAARRAGVPFKAW